MREGALWWRTFAKPCFRSLSTPCEEVWGFGPGHVPDSFHPRSEQPHDVAGRCSGNARLGFASLSSKETLISRRDSLSMILTRMTVSACSVDPWALHLPPGPTWHSSYHQAKLCCVCQIHIGIYETKNWRGRMLLTTCHIGCISPRRQARKRRTLQTSKTYFVMFVPVRKHQFDFSYGLCEPCSLSLCVDRRDLRSMKCAIPRGAPTLQSTHKRKL